MKFAQNFECFKNFIIHYPAPAHLGAIVHSCIRAFVHSCIRAFVRKTSLSRHYMREMYSSLVIIADPSESFARRLSWILW
jgi:hypothetical protein